jgi:hypothetical protein
MVWVDRSLFEDEPLIVLITIYFYSVFNFEFYFFQSITKKVASLCAIGETLFQCAIACWQPSSKFVIRRQSLLETL